MVGDLLSGQPGSAPVGRTAEVNFDFTPVLAVISAGLTVSQYGALCADNHAGDAIASDAIEARGEDLRDLWLQNWIIGTGRQRAHQEQEGKQYQHGRSQQHSETL